MQFLTGNGAGMPSLEESNLKEKSNPCRFSLDWRDKERHMGCCDVLPVEGEIGLTPGKMAKLDSLKGLRYKKIVIIYMSATGPGLPIVGCAQAQ